MSGDGAAPDDPLLAALRQHFGHDRFRPGQREIIDAVLAGVPMLGVLPTGAGKSLCFQLPALLLSGPTLVVSPLVALMRDQVRQLALRGIGAATLDASQTEAQRQGHIEAALRGELRLLYVSPERLRSPRLLQQLEGRVALLAIDEAHCISHWGHDFRPDYLRLAEVTRRLAPPRRVALTATATPDVRDDIGRVLDWPGLRSFVAGFGRPNLYLEVRGVRRHVDRLAQTVAALADGAPAIVYAATRKKVERIAGELRANNQAADAYHAGLAPPLRRAIESRFLNGELDVVVATNAFGLGIDRSDVRRVIHFHMPRSIEAWYQEVGRAGRDGAPASALLLFGHGDALFLRRLLASSYPPPLLVRDLWGLVRFEPVVSRTVEQLADVLAAEPPYVQAALRLLEEAGHLERQAALTPPAVIEVRDRRSHRDGPPGRLLELLRERVLPASVEEVPLEELVGALDRPLAEVRRALGQLHREGAIHLHDSPRRRGVVVRDLALPARGLRVDFEALARRHLHAERQLRRMVSFAAGRACRHGFVLRHFGEQAPRRCRGCDVCAPRLAGALAPELRTQETTRALVESGLSLAEVARLRGLSESTCVGHLVIALEQGRHVRLAGLVAPEHEQQIRALLELQPELGPEGLARALPGLPRTALRLVRAAFRRELGLRFPSL